MQFRSVPSVEICEGALISTETEHPTHVHTSVGSNMARIRLRVCMSYTFVVIAYVYLYFSCSPCRLGQTRTPATKAERALRIRTLGDDWAQVGGTPQKAKQRIAIITYDVAGPLLNGGIGTAYTNLACALGQAGLNVTVVLALGPFPAVSSGKDWTGWVADFESRCSVTLDALPPPAEVVVGGLGELERSYAAFLWLADREDSFDVVHFHEWRGIGYYSQLAKHQGLLLHDMFFVVGTHSPSVWSASGNMAPPTIVELQIDYMERESVRLADVVISPSRYMLEWMTEKHWILPDRLVVVPNVIDGGSAGVHRDSQEPAPIEEFVFFGRLETRKGFDMFVEAMSFLRKTKSFKPKVTLLGKISGRTSSESIAALQTFDNWKLLSNYSVDQASEYLSIPGRLAVMPSLSDNSPYTILECIARGIPFIASDVGGNQELIRLEDRTGALFAPNYASLADAILRSAKGAKKTRPSMPFQDITDSWIQWHKQSPRLPGSRPAVERHLVSVIIAAFSPDNLLEVVRAVGKQSYQQFEIIIVAVGVGHDKTDFGKTLADTAIVHLSEGTIGKAWNAGRAKAKGLILVFMETDAIRECFFVPAGLSSSGKVSLRHSPSMILKSHQTTSTML